MQQERRWYRSGRLTGLLLAGLLLGTFAVVTVQAQGPFSAQIQRALQAFVRQSHTWTAPQTFSGGVVGGAGGNPTTVQYNAAGSLAGDGNFFWDTTGQRLHILGGLTANNGPLLVTRRAPGGNPILATAASFYRNSQWAGGTPTVNDITNAEFLLQADDNLWYAVGGVGGKITNLSAAAVGGGTNFYCKPDGAGDTTVECSFLNAQGHLRVGDGASATATLEVLDRSTGHVLSSPTLQQNETIAVRSQAAAFTPGNPAGTTSTTDVMMGTGATMVFTPRQTGRVSIECSVIGANTTSGSGIFVTLYRGTGTAPVNGAAVTGTQTGGGKTFTAIANNQQLNLVLLAIPGGLTLNTQVWFDFAVRAVTSGTASIATISCTFLEI